MRSPLKEGSTSASSIGLKKEHDSPSTGLAASGSLSLDLQQDASASNEIQQNETPLSPNDDDSTYFSLLVSPDLSNNKGPSSSSTSVSKPSESKRVSFAAKSEDVAIVSTVSETADLTSSFCEFSVLTEDVNGAAPTAQTSLAKKADFWEGKNVEVCYENEISEKVNKALTVAENHYALGKVTNSTVNRCEDLLQQIILEQKKQKSTKLEQTATSHRNNKKGLSVASSSSVNRKKLTVPTGPACMNKKQERRSTKTKTTERQFRF